MKEKEKKHIAVELEDRGLETTDLNIKAYNAMKMNFDEVAEQITEWLDLIGAQDGEFGDVENERELEFVISKKYDTPYLKYGKNFLVVEHPEEMEESYEDFYQDYVRVDGQRDIFLIVNNRLDV